MGAQFSDYQFAFRHGEKYSLDRTSYKEGSFNIATDEGSLSIDIDGKRIELTDIITGYSEVEIRSITIPSNKVYLANDTFNMLVFDHNGGKWRRASAEMVLHSQMADQDGDGNDIISTYETKLDASATEGVLRGLITDLQYQINSINKFSLVFLLPDEELPETGENFVIYFVPNTSDNNDGLLDTDNVYAEYIWAETHYEQIGLITADLSDYFNSTSLVSATASSLESEARTETEDREYPVGIDANDKLSVNVPWTDTHYASETVVTDADNAVTNAAAGNDEVYINHVENGEVVSAHKITGSGATTVTSDANGVITISSTDNDTTYNAENGVVLDNGKFSADLKSTTKSALTAESMGNTADRQYAVGLDVDGKLSVNVPWTDNNTTYSNADDTTAGIAKLYDTAGTATDGSMTQNSIGETYATIASTVTGVSITNGQLSVTVDGTATATDIELDFGDEDE